MNNIVMNNKEAVKKTLTKENIMKLKPEMANFALKYSGIFSRIVDMVLPEDKIYDYNLNGNIGGSYTDGKRIVVSFFQDMFVWDGKEFTFDQKRAYIGVEFVTLHECGHVLYTNFANFVKYQQIIGDILIAEGIDADLARKTAADFLNICEDGRIEGRIGNRFPGAKKYIKYMRGMQLVDDSSLTFYKDTELKTQYNLFRNMVLSLATTGYFIQGYNKELAPRFPETHDELLKAKKHTDKAVKAITSKKCCEDVYEMILDSKDYIVERLKEIQKDAEAKQQLMDMLSDFDFETSADAEMEDADGEGEGEGSGAEGKAKGKAKGKGAKSKGKPLSEEFDVKEYHEDDDPTDDFSEDAFNEPLDMDEVLSAIEDELGKAAEGSMDSEDKSSKGGSSKSKESDIDLSEHPDYKNESIRHFEERKRDWALRELPSEYSQESKILRKEVEKFFQNRSIKDRRNRKSGTLNPKDIYKLGMGKHDVFVKKGIPNQTEAVVSICWDGSGSMYGSKQALSAKACAIIEEGFKGLVPMKIINFSVGRNVIHYCVKDFDDSDKKVNYSWSYSNSKGFSGGNKDGYSIRVCTEELMRRTEKDKILFVLSDGQPSDYNNYSFAKEDVRNAVKEAREKGIYVVALFFGTEDFRDSSRSEYEYMYQKNLIACDPKDITANLSRMIKRLVLR